MTDQRRGGSGRGEETPAPGYRGALPPRNDALARPWVLTVLGIFLLIIVLAFFNVPTTLFPESSPTPIPAVSVEPSPSGSGDASASAEASPSADASASGSASASASPSPLSQ
jgi:hypothetical protein